MCIIFLGGIPAVRRFSDANPYAKATVFMAGIKLQKEVGKSTGNPKITDYIAGKHYKEGMGAGSKLGFFQHAEGLIVVDGSSFDYEYNLTGPCRQII